VEQESLKDYSTCDRIVISGVNLNKVNIVTRMRK
jgi:hypothetical protein